MNDNSLYFPQQPYHWIGAEEEIATKEEMFQDNTIIPYDMQNYFINHFGSGYSNCDPNNNSNYYPRPNLVQQPDPKTTYISPHQVYERYPDEAGEMPLLKKMLQAPVGVSLQDLARPDSYFGTWTGSQFPNEFINDNNSDTLTADSDGNDVDTWDGYRYNGVLPTNYYFPKPVQDVNLSGNMMQQYQNNVQENCRNWLATNPVVNEVEPNRSDQMALLMDPLNQQNQVFTDLQGTSYYNQGVENFAYGQNGSESNTFVLPDQPAFFQQDAVTTFVDCNDTYNYELKYDSNDGVTYTVLNDNKGMPSGVQTENELSSLTAQVQTEVIETRNNEPLEPYWPSWRSSPNNKSLNLEIFLNVQSKTDMDVTRDDLGQVTYCCKTPVMSEKVNSQNIQLQNNGLPVENRRHNFNTYSLLFHTTSASETDNSMNNVQYEESWAKKSLQENTVTEMEMDVNLDQTGDFNYYFVQDYQECNIESENCEVAAAFLIPITDKE